MKTYRLFITKLYVCMWHYQRSNDLSSLLEQVVGADPVMENFAHNERKVSLSKNIVITANIRSFVPEGESRPTN